MELLMDLCLANTGLTPNRKRGRNPISPCARFNQFHFCTGHGVHLPMSPSPLSQWELRDFLATLGHQNLSGSIAAAWKGRHSKFIFVWIFNVTKALALHRPMWVPGEAWTRLLWVTSLWNHCVLTNRKGKRRWGEEKGGLPLMTRSQLCSLGGREERDEYENEGKLNGAETKGLALEPRSCLQSPSHWHVVGEGQERLERWRKERRFSTPIL